jgi:hypothetical protein
MYFDTCQCTPPPPKIKNVSGFKHKTIDYLREKSTLVTKINEDTKGGALSHMRKCTPPKKKIKINDDTKRGVAL